MARSVEYFYKGKLHRRCFPTAQHPTWIHVDPTWIPRGGGRGSPPGGPPGPPMGPRRAGNSPPRLPKAPPGPGDAGEVILDIF